MGELINPLSIVLHLFNLIVLLLVLYLLVYKPTKKFIAKRKEIVGEHFNKLDAENDRLQKKETALNEEKEQFENNKHQAYAATIADARAQSGKILELAELKADRLRTDAKKELQQEHEQYLARRTEAVADLACGIASRIIGEKLTREEHMHLIEEGIKEAERRGL